MKKNKIDENKIHEENIQKIKKELENKHKLPENTKEEMNRKIQINILIAITIMLYFFFLNVGFINIEQYSFLSDLKAFSIIILTGAIILFELAYKRDEGRYAIFGIEALILAIITLLLTYAVVFFSDKFKIVLVITSLTFTIYYTVKAIIIYFIQMVHLFVIQTRKNLKVILLKVLWINIKLLKIKRN